jgi:hypothetical protein
MTPKEHPKIEVGVHIVGKSIPKDDTSLTSFWSPILSFVNHYQLLTLKGWHQMIY